MEEFDKRVCLRVWTQREDEATHQSCVVFMTLMVCPRPLLRPFIHNWTGTRMVKQLGQF